MNNEIFAGCSSLKHLIIPSSVEMNEEYALSGCSNLTSVIIPSNVETIGDGAFSDCIKLRNVIISEGRINWRLYIFRM